MADKSQRQPSSAELLVWAERLDREARRIQEDPGVPRTLTGTRAQAMERRRMLVRTYAQAMPGPLEAIQ